MTGNIKLDIILILILVAATIWYIYSIKNDVINILKKKYYTLYIFHEGNEKFEKVATYKERSMRNAITKHFLSYNGNAELTHFRTYTDYNDYTMYYVLNVNGDTNMYAMLRESDGVNVEQR